MADTKIINIQKDDAFEEVFNEFERAEASEVIFIMPKSSKFARREEHFAALADAAASTERTITIMTADEAVHNYARKFGFKLLASAARKATSAKTLSNIKADDEVIGLPIDDAGKGEDDDAEPNDEELAALEEELEVEDKDSDDDVAIPLSVQPEPGIEPTEAPAGYTTELTAIRSDKGAIYPRINTAEDRIEAIRPRRLVDAKRTEAIEDDWLQKSANIGANLWGNILPPKEPPRGSGRLTGGRPNRRKKKWYFLAAGLVLIGGLLYVSLGSAKVVVSPKVEAVAFSMNLTVSEEYATPDPTLGRLPGQYLFAEKEISRQYPATDEKQVVQKARGEITVYNTFSSEPQPLVATTRFESDKGLIFRVPKAVTIPGAKISGGKTTPGSIVIPVIADKAGAEYNIGSSRFTIPGFKGGPKYDGFYGQSVAAMTGGKIGMAKVITEADITKGKAEVAEEALTAARAELLAKVGDNTKIVDPIANQVIETKTSAEAGDSFDAVEVSVKATAATVGIRRQDILDLITAYINKTGSWVLLSDGLEISYDNPKFAPEQKTLNAVMRVKGRAAAQLNREKIATDILGFSQQKFKEYIAGIKEIASVKVYFSPFWVHSIPDDKTKVKLEIEY